MHQISVKIIVAFVLLAFPLVLLAQEPSQKYALLIAVTKYDHSRMNEPLPLQFPEDDARAMAAVLQASDYEVDFVPGVNATAKEIRQKLAGLKRKGNETGTVFVGLWGHGVEFQGKDDSHFCPFDTSFSANGQLDLTSLIGLTEILTALRSSGAGNRVLVADCCRSSPLSPRSIQSRAFGDRIKVSDLPTNTTALFSCSAGEEAFESSLWKDADHAGHGAFTKCLLDLLPTMAAEGKDIERYTGDLRENVAQLVASVSDNSLKQTVNKISTGNPRLFLKSDGDAAKAPKNMPNASGAMNVIASDQPQNAKTASKDFWSGDISEPIARCLRTNSTWRSADSMADVFQIPSGEWIAIAVGKHDLSSKYPRDACEMHAHAKYLESVKGIDISSKRELKDGQLNKLIESAADGHLIPLPALTEWISEDGKYVSVLYGKVISK